MYTTNVSPQRGMCLFEVEAQSPYLRTRKGASRDSGHAFWGGVETERLGTELRLMVI